MMKTAMLDNIRFGLKNDLEAKALFNIVEKVLPGSM